MKRLTTLIRLLSMLVTAYAVYVELRKPEGERTWHGMVADLIPYDFRPPTWERVKSRVWNPDDQSIVMPTIFGVGWTFNFAQLFKLGQNFYQGVKPEAS